MRTRFHSLPLKIRVGLLAIFFILLFVSIPLFFNPPDRLSYDLEFEFAPPDQKFLFGRGENGESLLWLCILGLRSSLMISLTVMLLSCSLGVFLGCVFPLLGRRSDDFLMRVVEVFSAFPGILVALSFAFFLGPSFWGTVGALVLGSWVSFARLSRAQVLSLRERDFVVHAYSIGSSPVRIFWTCMMPNILPSLFVLMSQMLGGIVLTESSLSFLGLGATVGSLSLGGLLNSGREVMMTAPHVMIFPSILLTILVLSVNLISDGLRDFFDPHQLGPFKKSD